MILINREQLYKEVWTIPFTKLAPKYKTDPTKLRKLCEKLNIPLPMMGYWQKLSFGKTIPIPYLPLFPCCRLQPQKIMKKTAQSLIITKPSHKAPIIEVKKNLTGLHPLIMQARDKLQKVKTDKYGVKRPGYGYVNVRVSPANEKRALRIMDALLKWFEKNHIKIELSERSLDTYIHLCGQRISIALEEKTSVSKRTPEKWGDHTFYHTEFSPTNKLTLVIKEYCWENLQKVWSDGKRYQLEDMLGSFIEGLYIFAEYEKARTEKRKRDNEAYEQREREQKYLAQCAELEREMEKDLENQIQNWNFSQNLRTYISAVKEKANQIYGDEPYPDTLKAWVDWASEIADKRDPLHKSLPSYTKATDLIKQ